MEIEEPGMRERKKMRTRLAIESATVDLALERGYDAVTIEAIAERADITSRTFFNHFADKDDALLGIPRDQDAEQAPFPATLSATTPFGLGLELLRSFLVLLDDEMFALDLGRRQIIRDHPRLLVRELEKLMFVEDAVTAYLDTALGALGIAEGRDRTDQALAVTVTLTSIMRLTMTLWTRESDGTPGASSPQEHLTTSFDNAVAMITSLTTDGTSK